MDPQVQTPLLPSTHSISRTAVMGICEISPSANAAIYLEAERFGLTIEDRMRLEDEVCTVIYDATEQ